MQVHLDTDIGGDLDDLCALALALHWPGAELVGVTTVSDDAGKRAGYARYALRLAGRPDVPVAAGADISLGCYRVRPGLPDEAAYWPEPVQPAPGPVDEALALLEKAIRQKATIVAIGPYTNLALLEKRSPGILREADLYLMGGYLWPPRAGFPQWGADVDWNVQVDAQSAFCVLRASRPTLVPVSITAETALRRAYLPRLRAAGPLARLIAHQAEAFAVDEQYETKYGRTCPGLPEDIINFQHDPLTCAVALGWHDGVRIREIKLEVTLEDGWLRQREAPGGLPAHVVTSVDAAAFNALWLDVVAGS